MELHPPRKKRTRSGCFGCRCRKKKCDGVRPQCSPCQERGDPCRYGMKASFHPSRQIQLSAKDSSALLLLETERQSLPQCATQFVDNTAQIVRSYEGSCCTTANNADSYEQSRIEPITAPLPLLIPAEYSVSDTVTAAVSVPKHNFVPDAGISTTTATSTHERTPGPYDSGAAESRANQEVASPRASFDSGHSQEPCSTFLAPTYFDVDLPAQKLEQVQLIRAYLEGPGTWCEATDTHRHFTISYIHILMRNRPFAAAAMALASRQLDVIQRNPRDSTLRLYQCAVQSLLHYEPSQCGEATLVCCILLSIYEMITSNVLEWRRHLRGCVFNLKIKGWNGSSPGLVGASFWVFARIDLWAAYLLKERTLVPTDCWVAREDLSLGARTRTPDSYCNLATLLLAKIINVLAEGNRNNVDELWNDLQTWLSQRPLPILPVLRTEPSRGSPFPAILYAGNSSVCANTFYHTGCILLLRSGQVQTCRDNNTYDPVWHVNELLGTSLTNMSHSCWVNQVYPLYIAAEVFGRASDNVEVEEHAAEKFAILKHLARIERDTGWPTAKKASLLRELWGLGS